MAKHTIAKQDVTFSLLKKAHLDKKRITPHILCLLKTRYGLVNVLFLGFSVIRDQIFKPMSKLLVRFITFHDIMPNERKIFKKNSLALKNKTNVISLADFSAGRLVNDKVNTVITFDDGYKGWVTDVLPVLKKLRLPANFSVSSGFIGLSKDDESRFYKIKPFQKAATAENIRQSNEWSLKKDR